MDEKNRVSTDMTELLAAGLEQGMSRRERRELAARLAAEEEARRAAEEAAKPVEEVPAEEPAVIEIPEQPVAEEEPAAEPVVEAETEAEAETEEPAAESFDTPDEPTRIFKPLSARILGEEPAAQEPDVDEDDEDEDDEEEEEVKRSPFSFFRKKRAAKEEEEDEDEDLDDEDEEDYDEDDEEDFDEDEDEEEEPVEKKPRRGLFARKPRSVKYDEEDLDDEEDEDEEEDVDEDLGEDVDEDEYDEYDDFDDEEDDEDDYDDYDDEDLDDGRPLGVRIIGFFKGLFAFILCVLIVVFALNFLDYFNVLSLDSVFEHHYNKAPAVFDTLFPSHNLKKLIKPGETIEAIEPIDAVDTNAVVAATQVPVSVTPVPESTVG